MYVEGDAAPLRRPAGGAEAAALLVLRRARDEAHSAALLAHRHLRDDAGLRDALAALRVRGLGATRRAALLARFESWADLRLATEAQLRTVPGIGPELAAAPRALDAAPAVPAPPPPRPAAAAPPPELPAPRPGTPTLARGSGSMVGAAPVRPLRAARRRAIRASRPLLKPSSAQRIKDGPAAGDAPLIVDAAVRSALLTLGNITGGDGSAADEWEDIVATAATAAAAAAAEREFASDVRAALPGMALSPAAAAARDAAAVSRWREAERRSRERSVDTPSRDFELVAPYAPSAEQEQAVVALQNGVERGEARMVLKGATGTGKTFVMSELIRRLNRPTLVLAPNKVLAAQLCSEFKALFPRNAVECVT